MYHPGFGEPGEAGYVAEDTRKEFVELFNAGTNAINLGGWRLKGGVAFTIPGVLLEAGKYLVIAADGDTNRFKAAYQAQYPGVINAVVVGGWAGTLGNNGERITLEDVTGKKADEVVYSVEGDWARRRTGDPYPGSPSWWRGWQWTTGADAGGKSLELICPQASNKHGQNWGPSLNDGGTPGGANSILNLEIAPFITGVSHAPAIPKPAEAVSITARVEAAAGGAVTVAVHYRLDGAASFLAAAMQDDGLHGDGAPADGVYGAWLPAQPDKTVVEFYVQAANDQGKTRTWPPPTDDAGGQGANAFYQVDDTVYAGTQPVYRLVIPKAEWSAWLNLMDSTSGGQYCNATMNGAWVAVDGTGTEVRYCVGVRNRGAGTRSAHPHNLRVIIPRDRPWKNRSSLDLNTRTVHSQVAGNAINVMAGLPCAYGAPVQVRVNGENLAHLAPTGSTDSYQFGSYFYFEPYGTEWLAEHLPLDPAGNIYKGVWNFDGHSLAHQAGLGYLGEDPAAYRLRYSASGPTSATGSYTKQTNVAADDWADLIQLCQILSQSPDAEFLAQVNRVVNLAEWLDYFAVTTLVGNRETTFGTGTGDDYSMYRGVVDPRFILLAHDMDTTLGQGDVGADYGRSIFEACAIPAVSRLLKHPAIAPRYYAALKRHAGTTFAPERLNPLLDQVLGGWVPAGAIANMKDFAVQRRAGVLAQIPSGLAITTNLPVANGYLKASSATVSLQGTADATRARSVLVNGVAAGWTQWSAAWSAASVALHSGLNRVVVQALDEDGHEFIRSCVDVWYDNGKTTAVAGGTLSQNTTWTLANSPYQVAASVTVPAGKTLTIEPGVTVYFNAGASLAVNGQLWAQGTPYRRIRLTRPPGATGSWGGLQFADARQTNLLACADMEYGDANSPCVTIRNSQVTIERMTFFNMRAKYFDIWEPQVRIRHSTFGDLGSACFCTAEHMLADGWFSVEGNLFGTNTDDNDIFHLNRVSVKGGAAAQILNNVFTGAGDDLVDDNETDTHLEGNLFMHANEGNAGNHGASAAVTTGPGGITGMDNLLTQHLTVVRNVFYQNDYGIISKTGAYSWICNNVFVGNRGAILFDETDRDDAGPGRGALIESCIFWDNLPEDPAKKQGALVELDDARAFDSGRLSRGLPQVTVNHSLLPARFHALGQGNLQADPEFVNPAPSAVIDVSAPAYRTGFDGFDASPYLVAQGRLPDLGLKAGSPAIGTGHNGVDMGILVPTGASISGIPVSPAAQNKVTLAVAGLDIGGFKYRWSGPGFTNGWSREMQTMKPVAQITLSGEAATVLCPGHGYADGDAIQIIGADALTPYLNGTFAIRNAATDTFDYLVNPGTNAVLNQTQPRDLWCVKAEPIRLASLADGEYTVEVIRKNSLGAWQSESEPTRASWRVDTAMPGRVRLNEILAQNVGAWPHFGTYPDAIELYNEGGGPVDLAGMALGQNATNGTRFLFPPGTLLAAGDYLVVAADQAAGVPGWHAGFALDRSGGSLYLLDRAGVVVDGLSYGPQIADLSIGRLAAGQWGLTRPTPGSANLAEPTGDARDLRLNEWLASTRSAAPGDFIEVFNPGTLPIALGGLVLTDQPFAQAGLPAIAPLSFIAAKGFALFYADGQPASGANHLGFSLGSGPAAIGLFTAGREPIDRVYYGPQTPDVAQGRSPNGSASIVFLPEPTAGYVNPGSAAITNLSTQTIMLIASTNVWRYNQTTTPGADWMTHGYTGDAAWPAGAALLYVESDSKPWPKNTPLALGRTTYYFRTHFQVESNLAEAQLSFYSILDDGAVFYLNGREISRLHMPSGTVTYDTHASDHESTLEGPYSVSVTNLLAGDNVMAVEVHQVNSTSTDVVFGMSLAATITTTNIITNSVRMHARFNELLARAVAVTNQDGVVADWIELANPNGEALDLAGQSLTDDPLTSRKWVIPAGTVIPPRGCRVIQCAGPTNAASLNTGFGLKSEGGALYLFDTPANGGELLDSLAYGLQTRDLSVGRLDDGRWALAHPTPGQDNIPAVLGDPAGLKLNEWMANPASGSDWFEIHNPGPNPVDLGGLCLTDDLSQPGQYRVPPLSFIGAGASAWQKFVADGAPEKGANHTNFKLSAAGEALGLYLPSLARVDEVVFGLQAAGVSEGRYPDGSTNVVRFVDTPTPGQANVLNPQVVDRDGDGMPDDWELAHGLNPDDPSDALLDSDQDGLANLQEYLSGTDPHNPDSTLRLVAEAASNQDIILRFMAQPGRGYSVQYAGTLTGYAWLKLQDVAPQPAATAVAVADHRGPQDRERFYRVITPRAP